MRSNINNNYDLIRSVAIYFVVIIHSLGCVETNTYGLNEANLVNAIMSIVKCAVPLFVMLSGALLLGKEESIASFYKKRLMRLLPPFLIWSFIVYSLYYIKNNNDDFSIYDLFYNYIVQTFTSGVVSVYWYVYMILGLYLITPFLRKLVLSLNKFESYLFLCILLLLYIISQILPTVKIASRFISENYIYIFYYCFGYIYVKYKTSETNYISIIILLISWLLNVVNLVLGITTFPFVVFFSISCFSLLYNIRIPPKRIVIMFLNYCSRISYGVYLFHIIIISTFVSLDVFKNIPLVILPLILGSTTFIINLLFFYFVRKLNWLV